MQFPHAVPLLFRERLLKHLQNEDRILAGLDVAPVDLAPLLAQLHLIQAIRARQEQHEKFFKADFRKLRRRGWKHCRSAGFAR